MSDIEFRILHRDDNLVAIHKPSGFHVHQPEFPRKRVPPQIVCLSQLRRQLKTWVYPVHRLDVATSGVLLFALNKETAGELCRQFTKGDIKKTYYAITRGFAPDQGMISEPLMSDSSDQWLEAHTRYHCLQKVELPFAVGKKHSTARYSLVRAEPLTGRFHQIRRHLARISHPIIGDAAHGDSYHNRFFREQFGLHGLMLMAQEITLEMPEGQQKLSIVENTWPEKWHRAFTSLGFTLEGLTHSSKVQ